MITKAELQEMALDEKIKLMERIWEDIRGQEDTYGSPDWHRKELEETEKRRAEGLEMPLDWDEAKRKLLNRDDGI